jgi:hypothetical protein
MLPHLKVDEMKIKNQAYMEVRSKLQVQAKELEKEIAKTLRSTVIIEIIECAILKGKIDSYIKSRELLMPNVSSDRYVSSFKGALNKLNTLINDYN